MKRSKFSKERRPDARLGVIEAAPGSYVKARFTRLTCTRKLDLLLALVALALRWSARAADLLGLRADKALGARRQRQVALPHRLRRGPRLLRPTSSPPSPMARISLKTEKRSSCVVWRAKSSKRDLLAFSGLPAPKAGFAVDAVPLLELRWLSRAW